MQLPSWFKRQRHSYHLPGFGFNATLSIAFLGLFIILPISALLTKAGSEGWSYYWDTISSERAVSTYRVTIIAAFASTIFTAVFGLLLAWILERYLFPGRKVLDAIIDLPFALPTSVSGLALATLFATDGWLGKPIFDLFGIKVAFTPLGIAVAMSFTSIPFVVRAIQPVLRSLDPEYEEAAKALGASPFTIFRKVTFPPIAPALATGSTLAFGRSLGEYGSVIFIAGNIPYYSEITAVLVTIRLDEYDYIGSAAIATVMLGSAFLVILATNRIQHWGKRLAQS